MLPEATWVRPPSRAGLHRARRGLQLVTSLLFIFAPFLDILRFDVKHGALILFGASLDLGELGIAYAIILLTFIVVFAGALLWGRIYCGWMCPQTTLSELVATLERWACPRRGPRTWRCRLLSTAGSLLVAGFVAWSLVSYFLDRSEWFWPGPGTWIAWAVTAGVLAADFLWLRHRLCVGVCPYGILQNVIQDRRTLGVRLDPERRSECTDCLLCVRACFMGVDIRQQAFDPRCLNCGDCIAALGLAKRCPEEPLIAFKYGPEFQRSTASSRWPRWLAVAGVLDGRRAAVAALFFFGVGLVSVQALGRRDLDVHFTALYDRTTVEPGGVVRDHYRLALGNHTPAPLRLTLEASGLPGLAVEGPAQGIELPAGGRAEHEVVLRAPGGSPGAHPVTVRGLSAGGQVLFELPARFFVPDAR
jgi:polyferredoxin